MPRPAVTEPPAYEEGGICINVCKRERYRQCVYREECSNTRPLIRSVGRGKGKRMFARKRDRECNYTHSLILVLQQKAGLRPQNKATHTHTHTPGLLMYI